MLQRNKYKGRLEMKKPEGDPYKYHLTLPFVKKTPLHDHESYAESFGVGKVYIKEEGKRIELKSFKILGVSYALRRYSENHPDEDSPIFCGATDGNHGRALSYMCQRLGRECVIYVPFDTSKGRVKEIGKYGAKVIQTDVNYDRTMEICDEAAKKNGWINISDTAYGKDDMEVPIYIMQGYSSIFEESYTQIEENAMELPTHIFVQAGVGCLCASAGYYFHDKEKKHQPMLICVEPTSADCYMTSVKNQGKLTHSKGKLDSLMNGLNCGVPSYSAFPWVINSYSYMMTVDNDEIVKKQMRYLHDQEPKIIGGESGVAGLAALEMCMKNKEWKKQLGLDEKSVVMVVISEGDTDEDVYKKIIEERE